jgi:hypothetical protein
MKIHGNAVKVEVVYKDQDGKELVVYRTLSEVLNGNIEDIIDSCEQPCRTCYTESQNHCAPEYEDFDFDEILIDTAQFANQSRWARVKQGDEVQEGRYWIWFEHPTRGGYMDQHFLIDDMPYKYGTHICPIEQPQPPTE